MSEPRDPARLRDDETLRAVLRSASLDDDPAVLERLGTKLGFGPPLPTPTSAASEPAAAELPASGQSSGAGAGGGASGTVVLPVGPGLAALGLAALGLATLGLATLVAMRGVPPRDAGHAAAPAPVSPAAVPSSVSPGSDPSTVSFELAPPTLSSEAAPPAPRNAEASSESRPPHAFAEAERGAPRDVSAEAPEAAPRRAVVHRASPIDAPPERSLAAEPGTSSSTAGDLAAEVRLIQRIRAALVTDPPLALRLVEQHRTEFPNGRLITERKRLEERARSSAIAR